MDRIAVTILLSLALTFPRPTIAIRFAARDEENSASVVTPPSKELHKYASNHQSKEWIAAPNGHLYQFHAGDQSWLGAREFCLSQNSDLVVLSDEKQINWLLGHYAPTYSRFAERFIQVGLMIPDGPNREWTYLDGSKYNSSLIGWVSGEPFDHSVDGLERCALLRVHARLLDDVDCEAVPRNQMPVRFICERSKETHKHQQLSKNFIWRNLEKLLEYFGIGSADNITNKRNSTDKDDKDYADEGSKLNFTLKEQEEFKNMKFETSSEEEQEVMLLLKTLNKPGTTVTSSNKEAEGVTSPDSLQEIRPPTSNEVLQNRESATTIAFSSTDLQSTRIAPEKMATGAEESASVPDITNAAELAEQEATALLTTKEATVLSTTEGSSPRAYAVPLREITEEEGSGAGVDQRDIEKHEIDPEKLEKVINTLEKMVEKLESISVTETEAEEKKEPSSNLSVLKKEIPVKEEEKSKEDSQKEQIKKKEKANDTPASMPEKDKEMGTAQSEMEKDFDENLNKNLPTTDIKPPVDEDCEEASGERTTIKTPSDVAVKNAVETEDVDELPKPKISADREEHVQDFLRTLRTFLNRAEHNDLRKLLDNNPGKSLLEKMKLAIKEANEREFARLKELELLKRHGVNISNVPEPKLMDEGEREDLFKKISGVVMEEVEERGLQTATEPSGRTTTQETVRSTTELERKKEGVLISNSKEDTPDKKHIDEDDEKSEAKGVKETEIKTDLKKRTKEKEENHEEKDVIKPEEPVTKEPATEFQTNLEMPTRTVQLKEFENKEEVMSHEEKIEKTTKSDKESGEGLKEGESKGEKVNAETATKKKKKQVNSKDKHVHVKGKKKSRSSDENTSKEDTDPKETDLSSTHEPPEEEVAMTEMPLEKLEDRAEEVGTEKTPEKSKRGGKQKSASVVEESSSDSDDDDEDRRDSTNPLGLPTLPPPPTLPPLPGLEKVLDNLSEQFRKLFPPPKY